MSKKRKAAAFYPDDFSIHTCALSQQLSRREFKSIKEFLYLISIKNKTFLRLTLCGFCRAPLFAVRHLILQVGQEPAVLNDGHDIFRKRLAVIDFPRCQISDFAGHRLYLQQILVLDLIRLLTDHNGQADVDAVPIEYTGEKLRNDHGHTAALQRNGSGFASGAGAEVFAGNDTVS